MGFLAIIALTMLDELIALSSLVMGDHPFFADFRQSALKMLLILAVWFFVTAATRRLLARVRYLEGFMRICAWCRRVDYKGEWIGFEDFLRQGFDTPATHGICPVCLARQRKLMEEAPKSTPAPQPE
jgi:hypothetical protein